MVSVDKPKPMRYAVLEIIQANRRGITQDALVVQTGFTHKQVNNAISILVATKQIYSARGVKHELNYLAGAKPVPAPDRAPSRWYAPEGQYQGIELQRAPGIPDSRYLAFELPTRVADKLHWPCGRVTWLCGAPA